jgi:hypothetical protein
MRDAHDDILCANRCPRENIGHKDPHRLRGRVRRASTQECPAAAIFPNRVRVEHPNYTSWFWFYRAKPEAEPSGRPLRTSEVAVRAIGRFPPGAHHPQGSQPTFVFGNALQPYRLRRRTRPVLLWRPQPAQQPTDGRPPNERHRNYLYRSLSAPHIPRSAFTHSILTTTSSRRPFLRDSMLTAASRFQAGQSPPTRPYPNAYRAKR